MVRSTGERMALNTPVQGSSSDIIKKAMIEIFDEFNRLGLKSKMLIQVHDELLFNVLDNEEEIDRLISVYSKETLPSYCTMHGAFFDVIPFSLDPQIRKISLERIEQSILIAKEIGARGVVFHTNYNPFLSSEEYVTSWVKNNVEIWSEILSANPDIEIYLENMFDTTPNIMVKLSEELCKYDNYGVCLDYAHAAISKTDPEEWARVLSPYIKHVHINDNDLISDLHLAWGDGKIDRQSFYKCYNKYMSDATVLIETNSIENINRSLDRLKAEGFI
jgi:sugar phosphate isomerase/epimerase